MDRRQFLKTAGGLTAGVSTGLIGLPVLRDWAQENNFPLATQNKLDYLTAKPVPSICFGCTTHCGVLGWVKDGMVQKIEGNPLDPNSQGKICAKAQGMISYTYYPERIVYPLKRMGKRGEGKWKRISWEEALGEIAMRMKKIQQQPEKFVFHYGRDKTKGYTKRFTNAFGTPNRLNRRSICSSNRRVPLMSFYGREFEWETQDFLKTRYILNFGANPMEAHQGGFFMMQRIQKARVDHGAKMISFEVRPSATVSVSDEYFPVMPGTDGVIALAMANVIIDEKLYNKDFWERWVNVSLKEVKKEIAPFDAKFAEVESGVAAPEIVRIAREFAQAAPHCCTMSNRGSAKHYNGYQADRAIRLLDVLVGNVGKPGGFCLSSLRSWTGKYGQDGLPILKMPSPNPPAPKPFLPGTPQFANLPQDIQKRVSKFPGAWQKKYFGELATPSEYPLSWHWYSMRVGQLVYHYIKEKRAEVEVYMSYTLGAAYGYPEANVAREVLSDESLIPFHVAIDIGYSEQAALADIILPEATSLERWDHHSTNSYSLVPYTGMRQPMVPPLGEARSIQTILRQLAHHIGGGMEKYFDFKDEEDFYRQWYANLPISWEEFKKRGIWYDSKRKPDYELYERPVLAKNLEGNWVDQDTQIIYNKKKGKTVAMGIMQDGKAVQGFPTPSRKIQVYDEIFPQAAKYAEKEFAPEDKCASPLPTYFKVPGHQNLQQDQFVFITFKWNVHTQGRSGHLKYQAEIVHSNPIFIHPESAKRLALKNGDKVRVTIHRPHGLTYKSQEQKPVGTIVNRVRLLPGVHPKVLACSHHLGHWKHGAVGQSSKKYDPHSKQGNASDLSALQDPDIPKRIWWANEDKKALGTHLNDALPINPSPLVGGQNWFDNICTIEKI